jgi:hypothetical protein
LLLLDENEEADQPIVQADHDAEVKHVAGQW